MWIVDGNFRNQWRFLFVCQSELTHTSQSLHVGTESLTAAAVVKEQPVPLDFAPLWHLQYLYTLG